MHTNQPAKLYFEDYPVGRVFCSLSYRLTAEDIVEFASKWDPQPFHTDADAAKASDFGGLTACSAHIFAVFCKISQQIENGAQTQALAGLGFERVHMLLPVFAGDVLRCESRVDEARRSRSRPDRGVVGSHSCLYNQRGDAVFECHSRYLLRCRPPNDPR